MRSLLSLIAVLICVVTLAASHAGAYTTDQVEIESVSGSGASSALLVVDFWMGNGQSDSFAFVGQFDGSISGLDLLDIVKAGDGNFDYADGGGFITDFWYTDPDTSTTYHTGYDWPNAWWNYWASDDHGQTWSSLFVGLGDRVVTDGATDGWLGKPGTDFDTPPVTPLVPEPASLLLLGSAATALLRRRVH